MQFCGLIVCTRRRSKKKNVCCVANNRNQRAIRSAADDRSCWRARCQKRRSYTLDRTLVRRVSLARSEFVVRPRKSSLIKLGTRVDRSWDRSQECELDFLAASSATRPLNCAAGIDSKVKPCRSAHRPRNTMALLRARNGLSPFLLGA